MMKTLKWLAVLATLVVALPAGAFAQRISLDVDTKDLAAKAIETVEVTLDGQLLKAAARFLATQDPKDAELAVIRRLEGIYVRSYTFANENEYDRAAVQKFRSTIGPGWQKIVNVQKVGEENVEIFTHLQGDLIDGITIIAAEPKELTFVNIVGPLDLAELGALEGQFGIPKLEKGAKGK
jgi:hypothetical protein